MEFLSQYSIAYLDRLILAFPMILISLNLIYKVIENLNLKNLLKFNIKGIFDVTVFGCEVKNCFLRENNEKENYKHYREKQNIKQIFFIFTFVNFLANFIVVSTIANVQIINRIATSNPILYIFCSDYILKYKNQNIIYGKFILIIFLSFSIIGCIMHCASYGYA